MTYVRTLLFALLFSTTSAMMGHTKQSLTSQRMQQPNHRLGGRTGKLSTVINANGQMSFEEGGDILPDRTRAQGRHSQPAGGRVEVTALPDGTPIVNFR